MNKTIKKIIKGIMIFQFLVTTIFAGGLLENGRWNPVNREKLEKLIENNRGKGNYVVFDWDYTSIYQDTQENLFRYQIDNLKFKMTPAEFKKAIRKDIPMDNFADEFKNVDGQNINIEKIGEDLDKDYTFLYENYIKNKK